MNVLSTANLDKSHPFRQWLTWKIPNTDLTIEGYSRASDKTFFFIPQLRTCLDASLAEGRKGEQVFITHGHSDHVTDIEFLSSKAGVQIYTPKVLTTHLDNYIHACRQIYHSGTYDPEKRGKDYTLNGLEANEVISFKRKNQTYQVKTFHCDHKVPCLGYAFAQSKKRLKPEFAALQAEMSKADFGKLLGNKRKEGIEIQETYLDPIFAYAGDTHASNYAKQDWLWDYPCLITECTYIKDEDLARADERKHTHWEHLRPYVLAHPETTFVLIHFSLRYPDAEILEFFEQERAKYGFDNVKLWISDAPLLQQQHQQNT
ncbi:MAG: MBL fold metallo-hydrolase [Saprospiraceae bacterium]|nr:MBL fold metallo-hydrolase [Saprospiraceae bacterium]